MSIYDDERNEYKIKVGKQKEAIANLLDLSNKHIGLFDDLMVKDLRNCKTKCEKLYKKLENNEFEIAIVGLEKAGKSTFGNALMENRILPDADERCTYTSTCIKYGDDRAVVKFFKMPEMDNVLRGYLDTLGVENTEAYTYTSLSRSEYMNLFNSLDQRDKDRFENTVHQDILNLLDNKNDIVDRFIGKQEKVFKGKELYEDSFKEYIISPKVAVAVKEVCIESSKLGKMSNAIIYDVPGFDSPTSMHLEQTKERMKEADAIMLIGSAEKPSFTAPALKMFQEVVDEDNVALSDKLFVFGNRADAANTLGKNIDTLKSEVTKWKLLSGNQIEERLIIGSAKAHLQKLHIVDGDNCIKIVEENTEYKNAWSHGDGIDYAYNKLVDYNQSERFDVLKKKIRKNDEELRSIFNELKNKYSEKGYDIDCRQLLSGISSLQREAKEKILKELEIIRREIRTKYKDDLVLSKKLQEKVLSLFEDEEKYLITSEDIENAELKIIDISGSTNVEKVEEIIREDKFNQIYDDFTKTAFSVAQNDHVGYYTRIIDCIESALGIHKKFKNYDELHNMVIGFVGKYVNAEEDEFIYQSVIERFVRDVMEILIYRPYSSEARLNKFVDEAEVFSGLIMFYNPGDANEGYKRQFLSVAPKNQPLLLALVFHEYKDVDGCSKDVFNYIGNICKSLCDNPEVVQLVFSIIKKDPKGAVQAIKNVIEDATKGNVTRDLGRKCKTDEDYARTVIPNLRTLKNSNLIKETGNDIKMQDFDFTDSKIFAKQYKQYFGNKAVRTYDDVCEFFKDDLEILEKFLIHASIPAIRLEKPFVSREVQSINKLLLAVNSIEFDNMINDNSRILLPMVYENIDREVANSLANKATIGEVEKIMKTLEDAG